jgi:Tfp pilus assembly protein FimT
MIEIIVVVAVLSILSAVSYPLLKGRQPEAKVTSASNRLESLLQKARIMAINQQRPVRVIVNCTRPSGFESCFIDLQTAVYVESAVTGWQKHPADHYVFDKIVRVSKTDPAAIYDGATTIPNIFWLIFMPASQVYSDPRKFELFLYHDGQTLAEKSGWRLSVDNVSGRVATCRGEFVPLF